MSVAYVQGMFFVFHLICFGFRSRAPPRHVKDEYDFLSELGRFVQCVVFDFSCTDRQDSGDRLVLFTKVRTRRPGNLLRSNVLTSGFLMVRVCNAFLFSYELKMLDLREFAPRFSSSSAVIIRILFNSTTTLRTKRICISCSSCCWVENSLTAL